MKDRKKIEKEGVKRLKKKEQNIEKKKIEEKDWKKHRI